MKGSDVLLLVGIAAALGVAFMRRTGDSGTGAQVAPSPVVPVPESTPPVLEELEPVLVPPVQVVPEAPVQNPVVETSHEVVAPVAVAECRCHDSGRVSEHGYHWIHCNPPILNNVGGFWTENNARALWEEAYRLCPGSVPPVTDSPSQLSQYQLAAAVTEAQRRLTEQVAAYNEYSCGPNTPLGDLYCIESRKHRLNALTLELALAQARMSEPANVFALQQQQLASESAWQAWYAWWLPQAQAEQDAAARFE